LKLLVETTGKFMLLDLGGNQQVPSQRPGVVARNTFIETRVAGDQLTILGQVSDEATDAEFAKYWAESEDRDLAIESFMAAYPHEPKPAPAPAPKKRAGK
jgi:hypothetical protein